MMPSKILDCLCAIAVLFYFTQLPATALTSYPRSQPLPSTHSTLSPSEAYYVATDGSDTLGDGSSAHPWATISHALLNVPDSSTIWVRPGVYNGQVQLRGQFAQGVFVVSEEPYHAVLYWNGAAAIPQDPAELINITADAHAQISDPLLGSQVGLVLPRWLPASSLFADGSTHISQAFRAPRSSVWRHLPWQPSSGRRGPSPISGRGSPRQPP